MKWLADIASGIVSPVTNLFTKRNENKTKVKLSQIERLKNSDDALATWEQIQAENSGNSWRDEFWTIILSIPLILCFFPEMVPHVKAGFQALEEMPDFYQYWLGAAVLTSFGIRLGKK